MQQYPIGISASEGIASDATPILEDDRYTLGIVFRRQRGIPDMPTLVTSLQEDKKLFGDHIAGAYGSYVVEQLFRNVGNIGARFYGVRKVGAGATPANAVIGMNTGTAPATITTQQIIAAAPNQYANNYYFFNNVHVGDVFTIGGVSFTATEATPENVAAGLGMALGSNQAIAADHWVGWWGNVLQIQRNAPNVPIALVTAVTPVAGTAVTIMTVTAGQKGFNDPGVWGNGITTKLYPYGALQVGAISLEVYLGVDRVEQFSAGSMADLIAQVNGSSEYIVLSNYASGAAPTALITTVLAGGADGAALAEADYYPVDDAVSPKSFSALGGLKVSTVFQTEVFTNTIAAVLRDWAQKNRRIAIAFLPYLASTATADLFKTTLQTRSVLSRSIAVYDEWDEVSDGDGGWKWIPAFGRAIGAGWLRIPQMNNDSIWFPPAGFDSVGTGMRNTIPIDRTQSLIDEYVRNKTINVSKRQQGKGTYLVSSRTMSTHPLFMSIHISRLTNFLLGSLEQTFDKVLQKPNTPELRITIISEITTYFKRLYDEGALERSVPFETAFKVICDISNNPLGADRKQLTVDIYWIPSECIEAMHINLNRNDGILIASVMDSAAAA
jgi:hypothetical protein